MKRNFRLLAIETSCDETAAAVVEFELPKKQKLESLAIRPLSNVVHSQLDIHRPYGGVYPTLAKREHQKNLPAVLAKALKEGLGSSNLSKAKEKLSALAVTVGPGLEPALWEGINFTKKLAKKTSLPVFPINHLEGHIYSNFVRANVNCQLSTVNRPEFPLIASVASGGHTLLVLMKKHLDYEVIGETLDDASGEAFDKCGRLLGLDYPAGPQIDKLARLPTPGIGGQARKGNPKAFDFPRPMIKSPDLSFSFAGLKTAFLYKLSELLKIDPNKLWQLTRKSKGAIPGLTDKLKTDLAASLEAAIVEVLVEKTLRATRKFKVKSIIVGGGVAANSRLRREFEVKSQKSKVKIFLAPKNLATDNALTIATAACYHFVFRKPASPQSLKARANLKLGLAKSIDF